MCICPSSIHFNININRTLILDPLKTLKSIEYVIESQRVCQLYCEEGWLQYFFFLREDVSKNHRIVRTISASCIASIGNSLIWWWFSNPTHFSEVWGRTLEERKETEDRKQQVYASFPSPFMPSPSTLLFLFLQAERITKFYKSKNMWL